MVKQAAGFVTLAVSALAFAAPNALSKRETHTAQMTWYGTDTGADYCTGRTHSDSDFVVALASQEMGQSWCGKQVTITYKGKSATATIVDECATCAPFQLDATKGLFQFLVGDLGTGQVTMSWSVGGGDGGDGGDDDKPTTTHKPATTHQAAPTTHKITFIPKPSPTTHKTTSTTKKTTTTHTSTSTSETSTSTVKSSTSISSTVKPSSTFSYVISSPSSSAIPTTSTSISYGAPVANDAPDPTAVVTSDAATSTDSGSPAQIQGGVGQNGPLTGAASPAYTLKPFATLSAMALLFLLGAF